jgi:hypothetical protein
VICSLIDMNFQFFRHFPQMIGVVQTAHVNFVMNILVMMLKTLLMLILHCVVVPSAKNSVCDLFLLFLHSSFNFKVFDNSYTRFLLLFSTVFFMVNIIFEYSIMMMSADHQACSPEIDSITSDSDQSCNLFCQQSCRLVLLL